MLYTPAVRNRYPDQSTQDLGRHEITFALAAHRGGWEGGRTPWQAARLNQPLRAFLPEAHPGPLGRSFSLVAINSDQVQIAAVKQAEDSDEIVVRLKELTGQPATGLALRFPAAIGAAREVDAQERPIGSAPVKDGALVFDMKKFGLRAFALKVAPATVVARVTSQAVPLVYDTAVASSRAQRTEGAMDKDGGAYPAEMFPGGLQQEGVEFQLGPAGGGAKSAVVARGQQLPLPAGEFNRVHVLAAASDGDAAARIKVGEAERPFDVPNWTGYVGQWDNRLWDPAEESLEHKSPPIGLVPGFVKRAPVAWFATHHSTPQGDAFYEYSYLFQFSYDLPPGTKSLTLPNDPKIRVFAVSVSREPTAAPPAAPLYDTLADHQAGGVPIIPQAGQSFRDATEITLLPPLYHRPRDLRYTLDGSEPTAASRVYDGPFTIADTANVAVRQITSDGQAGPVARGVVTVHDETPPRLLDAVAGTSGNTLRLSFSEPLAAAPAQDPENYVVQPPLALISATPSADRREVVLTFGQPMAAGTAYTLTLRKLKDTAPGANLIQPVTRQFNARNIVYSFDRPKLPSGGVNQPVAGLPVLKADHWTMNVLVRADAKPTERVVIAGFGQDAEEPAGGGSNRYFAVYPDGIHFLVSPQADVKTNSPLDLGRWQMLTATYDGDSLTIYKDAAPIMKKRIGIDAGAEPVVSVGVPDPWDHRRAFAGGIERFTVRRGALNDAAVKQLLAETVPAE
jgi:alpha-mannosidase